MASLAAAVAFKPRRRICPTMPSMAAMRLLVRYGYAPTLLLGANGAALWLLETGRSPLLLGPLLMGAIALSFVAESILPYEIDWNRSHGDARRDAMHAVVNEAANAASIAATPVLAAAIAVEGLWPHTWPTALQVLGAVLVLDAGVTAAHALSHRWLLLWRFHAVHHSVERMYGLNGLMKHPVHQAIEMMAGAMPLVLMGMPSDVAVATGFCTAVQLLLQHSNVDCELGPLERWIACNRVHRFHHVREPGRGDVNFGLFTTVWDRLFGTFVYDPARRFASGDLGLAAPGDYPRSWLGQMLEPFRRRQEAA